MRIFIPCGYSVRNAGDALLVKNLIQELRKIHQSCDVTVGSVTPLRDSAAYGVDCELPPFDPTSKPIAILKGPIQKIAGQRIANVGVAVLFALWLLRMTLARRPESRFDIAVAAPGGYLMAPRWSDTDWLHQLATLYLVKRCRVPLVLSSASFGPFAWPQGILLRPILRYASAVHCREQKSLEIVRRIEPTCSVKAVPDLAFVTTPCPLDRERAEDLVAFSVRPYTFPEDPNPQLAFQRYKSTIIDTAKCLSARGYRIEFVAQTEEDTQLSQSFTFDLRELGIASSLATVAGIPEALREYYGSVRLLIATRLHAGLIGLSAGASVVFIAYEHKTAGICNQLNPRPPFLSIYAPAGLASLAVEELGRKPLSYQAEFVRLGTQVSDELLMGTTRVAVARA